MWSRPSGELLRKKVKSSGLLVAALAVVIDGRVIKPMQTNANLYLGMFSLQDGFHDSPKSTHD